MSRLRSFSWIMVILIASAVLAGEWHIETVDDEGNQAGRWLDVALDSQDHAHISYKQGTAPSQWIPTTIPILPIRCISAIRIIATG